MGNEGRRIALKIDLFGLRLRKQRGPWIRTDKKISKDTKRDTDAGQEGGGNSERALRHDGEMVQANANEYLLEHKLRD